jgi:hypothetical protein
MLGRFKGWPFYNYKSSQHIMAQYGKPEYWEDRYNKDKEPFDWYQRWSGIKDVVTQFIQPNHQILNVGAGSSRKFSDFKQLCRPDGGNVSRWFREHNQH